MEARRVRVGPIACNIVGSGYPVLLVHGFPDSCSLWEQQVCELSMSGYMVLAPDMIGYGDSEKPSETKQYRLSEVVKLLLALLDKLCVQRCHLVGHDWGAATAWKFSLVYPERVSSLVVLSVGHPGGGPAAGGLRQRAASWYMLFFQYVGTAEEALRGNDWQLFRQFMAPAGEAATQAYIDNLSQPGALTAALNWYRANFRVDVFGATQVNPTKWPKVQCPVLGVWGSADKALTEQQMTVSEQFVAPGCWQYVRLEGVGHWIPREAPAQLNALLLKFWSPVPRM